jgi:hypothetical protein
MFQELFNAWLREAKKKKGSISTILLLLMTMVYLTVEYGIPYVKKDMEFKRTMIENSNREKERECIKTLNDKIKGMPDTNYVKEVIVNAIKNSESRMAELQDKKMDVFIKYSNKMSEELLREVIQMQRVDVSVIGCDTLKSNYN